MLGADTKWHLLKRMLSDLSKVSQSTYSILLFSIASAILSKDIVLAIILFQPPPQSLSQSFYWLLLFLLLLWLMGVVFYAHLKDLTADLSLWIPRETWLYLLQPSLNLLFCNSDLWFLCWYFESEIHRWKYVCVYSLNQELNKIMAVFTWWSVKSNRGLTIT